MYIGGIVEVNSDCITLGTKKKAVAVAAAAS